MDSESQEIKIIGVEREAIKPSSDKKNFWVVPFTLSRRPDESWERKLREIQEEDDDEMKRQARVLGDSLEVQISENDDLQKIFDVIKKEVAEANKQCEEYHEKKLKIRRQLEEVRQKQANSMQKFKDDADKLEF